MKYLPISLIMDAINKCNIYLAKDRTKIIISRAVKIMNKLIVVTGGTKGIGRAIIDRFAGANFDIATCSRNQTDLSALKRVLETKYPGITVFVQVADMADKKQVADFCS